MPVRRDPGRLLLTIHHLAVDGVSWRILVPDLAAAWQAISSGQAVALAGRGTSFRRWAEHLAAQAQDGRVVDELSFWSGELGKPSLLLARDGLDAVRDVAGTAGHLTLTLPTEVTQALLTRVAAAFHGGIDDVLLTGLAVAVADWCRRQGAGSGAGQAVLLDLEGHGREELLGRDELLQVSGDEGPGDIDLTRTVGWFTSLYPVRLDPGPLDLGAGAGGGRAAWPRAQDHQGAVARGAGQGARLWAAALSQCRDRGDAGRTACAAAWLQLSGAVCRRRRRRDVGAGGHGRGCAAFAAAIRRCRWRM